MYLLWAQDDGTLAGNRFDTKIANYNEKIGDLDAKVALSKDNEAGLLSAMGYGEDVEKTTANETNAYLKVAGDYYSVGTLLGSGSAEPVDGSLTIVADVKSELESIRSEAEAVIGVFEEPGQAGALQSAMNNLWDSATCESEGKPGIPADTAGAFDPGESSDWGASASAATGTCARCWCIAPGRAWRRCRSARTGWGATAVARGEGPPDRDRRPRSLPGADRLGDPA